MCFWKLPQIISPKIEEEANKIEYLSVNLEIENNLEQKTGSENEAYKTADEDNGDLDLPVTISIEDAELI